ncbi:hypothetical protein [Sutterella sp.]|uniref:hypothetical protein n=1 Tax=Sutterella sp. TaxID=1981025 RepID=UPI0025F1ED89|nr:hypothetical protein [uncultured Sutterella sp.]
MGPLKSLASQSQVIALEPGRVQLRLGVHSLLTDANRRLLEERVSAWLGRPFRVVFEAGDAEAGSTVADAVRAQKAAERSALVERFRRDPVVEEIVRRFDGAVDEASVEALDPAAK